MAIADDEGRRAADALRDAPSRARAVLVLAALGMALAVALGAYGAHGLRARASDEMVAVWQTAVTYHAWHALALLGVGLLMLQAPARRGFVAVAVLFVLGAALFSGSLYLLAFSGMRGLGVVTPVGGGALIGGWLWLAWSVGRRNS